MSNNADNPAGFEDQAERRRRSIRTALFLGAIAMAFYLGFIAMGVLRA